MRNFFINLSIKLFDMSDRKITIFTTCISRLFSRSRIQLISIDGKCARSIPFLNCKKTNFFDFISNKSINYFRILY